MNAYVTPLDALGDGTRREILELLRGRPAAVGELAARLPVSRPAVSQHLRLLEEAGLVSHTRQGTRHVYAVRREGLEEVRTWVERFWDDALARYAAAAEHRADVERPPGAETTTTTRRRSEG